MLVFNKIFTKLLLFTVNEKVQFTVTPKNRIKSQIQEL